MNNQPSRRHILGLATGTVVAGLAGCLTEDAQSETDTSPNDSASNSSEETDNQTSEEEEANSTNESDHNETDAASESAAEVTMLTNDSGTHFDPHIVEIAPGETVTWILESGSHTTTAYASANDTPQRIPEDAGAWDSEIIDEQGATFEHTFETEGVYDYYCRPHESTGMIGSVIVGDPQLDEQPGMAEPQFELPDGAQEKIRELNEMVRSGGESNHGDHGNGNHDDDGDHEHDTNTNLSAPNTNARKPNTTKYKPNMRSK